MSDYIFHVDVTCESYDRVGRLADQELIQNHVPEAGETKNFRCSQSNAVGEMRTRVDYRESVASDFEKE